MKSILWYVFAGILVLAGFGRAWIAFEEGGLMNWVVVGLLFVGAWHVFNRADDQAS